MMWQYSVYFTYLLEYAKNFFLTQKLVAFQKTTGGCIIIEVLVKNYSASCLFSSTCEISLLYTHFYFCQQGQKSI